MRTDLHLNLIVRLAELSLNVTEPSLTNLPLPVLIPQGTDAEMLDGLRRCTFDYFRNEVNPRTGLIADKTQPGSPSSIAAVGMALSVYIVAVERDLLSRAEAVDRTLKLLRFFHASHQSPEADATGYKGFYYHFLDMQTGRRAGQCELSTIDTAILMAGVLTAAVISTGKSRREREIRELAETLYRRVDWQWALNGGTTFSHGWKPESGFLAYRWDTRLQRSADPLRAGLGIADVSHRSARLPGMDLNF